MKRKIINKLKQFFTSKRELPTVFYDYQTQKNISEMRIILENTAFSANLTKNGQSYLFDKGPIVTRIFTGQKMFVDTADISLAPHIILDGQWETEITNIFLSLIQSDSVVLDVGANFGWFTLIAGTKVSQSAGGSIHAFEPNEYLTQLLEKSVIINGINRFCKINKLAVSNNSTKSVYLNKIKDLWGSSYVTTEHSHNNLIEQVVEVEAVSIDRYCEQNNLNKVDVIKIDVEGFEEHVWDGMLNTINNNKNNLKIMLEFTASSYKDPEKFFRTIQDSFKYIYMIDGNNLTLIDSYNRFVDKFSHGWVMLLIRN